MPEALLAPLLEALIWGLFGIIALSVIRQLVVQPIKNASGMVSGLPVIGGALAWAIGQVALAIEILLDSMWQITELSRQGAMSAWNQVSAGTVRAYFYNIDGVLYWVNTYWRDATNIINAWPAIWVQSWATLPSWIANIGSDLNGLHGFINSVVLTGIDSLSRDLSGLHNWMNTVQIPWINTIGNDLAGLHQWIDHNVALRSDVVNAENYVLQQTQALVAPIAAAVTAIEDSPCMQTCDVLGGVGDILQGLEDAGMLVIMLGLVSECLSDPGSVQNVLRAAVVPLVHDAASSIGYDK